MASSGTSFGIETEYLPSAEDAQRMPIAFLTVMPEPGLEKLVTLFGPAETFHRVWHINHLVPDLPKLRGAPGVFPSAIPTKYFLGTEPMYFG